MARSKSEAPRRSLSRAVFLFAFAISLATTSCAQTARQYKGPKRDASQVATIKIADAVAGVAFVPKEQIEGFGKPGLGWWKTWEFELLPGDYRVVTGGLKETKIAERRNARIPLPLKVLAVAAILFVTQGHAVSTRGKTPRVCKSRTVNLTAKAGHTYRIDGDFINGVCWLWIEDVKSGEVVAGSKSKDRS